MLADHGHGLGGRDVVPGSPARLIGDGVEIFLDNLLSPTQFIAPPWRDYGRSYERFIFGTATLRLMENSNRRSLLCSFGGKAEYGFYNPGRVSRTECGDRDIRALSSTQQRHERRQRCSELVDECLRYAS